MSDPTINDLFDLKGKIGLVTGGYGLLGRAISIGLSEAGATVVVAGRNGSKCLDMARELPVSGAGIELDITNDESVKDCITYVKSEYGKLDILVNNAAQIVGGSLLEMTPSDFNGTLDGTLTSVFRLIQAAVPIMKGIKQGSSIINIASMYGMVSPDYRIYKNLPDVENPPDYGAAKAGVIQLTKYTACKLANLNIRVNSISPGPFPNEDILSQDFIHTLSSRTPMNRTAKPWEIKGSVVFLASGASSYITGHNLVIDGGWTIW